MILACGGRAGPGRERCAGDLVREAANVVGRHRRVRRVCAEIGPEIDPHHPHPLLPGQLPPQLLLSHLLPLFPRLVAVPLGLQLHLPLGLADLVLPHAVRAGERHPALVRLMAGMLCRGGPRRRPALLLVAGQQDARRRVGHRHAGAAARRVTILVVLLLLPGEGGGGLAAENMRTCRHL